MDVSHFELVYKPQSPAGPADTVLQGYFLEITNLEERELQFALRLTTSSISDPDRSLFGNAAVFVDTPGTNNNSGVFTLTGGLTSSSFGLNRRIIVPPNGTALVAVLPSDPFPPGSVPGNMADFECRGFATLTLPPICIPLENPGGFPFCILQSQGATAKVLLTAQNRALYSDPDTGEPKGQTQGNLPLTTGQSLNEITPQNPFILGRPLDLSAGAAFEASEFAFEDVLAGMLATAAESKMDMKKFNAALKKSKVGVAIESRKV
jgi:hypothetical protein